MLVPIDRIRTCSAALIFSANVPLDYAKNQIAELLAAEIKAKLLEFDKIRIMETMADGSILVGCHVDVIVPK
jgi:hypothetical protein